MSVYNFFKGQYLVVIAISLLFTYSADLHAESKAKVESEQLANNVVDQN